MPHDYNIVMGDFIENSPSFILLLASMLVGVGIWLGSMEDNTSTLKKSVEEMKGDIKNILDKLSKIPTKTLEIQSPSHLNDLGKEVQDAHCIHRQGKTSASGNRD